MLWRKCPKNKFVGKIKVELSVFETIMEFNTGTSCITQMHAEMGSIVTSNMRNSLRKRNISRIKTATKQITDHARVVRRKKRAEKKSSANSKNSYKAGSFGTKITPEFYVEPETVKIKFVYDQEVPNWTSLY